MRRLALSVCALALAGCESSSEVIPAKTPLFLTDDCALLVAIGRGEYKLARDNPPIAVRLNGEDAPWEPGCDWSSAGFNLIEVRGPEGEAATRNLDRISFNRPRYDMLGALIRTSSTRNGATSGAVCRVVRSEGVWTLDSCGPDPKLTQPRPAAPSPADQTPEGRAAPPPGPPADLLRGRIPEPDPGQPRPGEQQ